MAHFEISDRDLSIWDTETHSWKIIKGNYMVYFGSSSRDLRYKVMLPIH